MTMLLLWWSLVSIAVSLVAGAFLQYGRHETETRDWELDLDGSPEDGAAAQRAGGHPLT